MSTVLDSVSDVTMRLTFPAVGLEKFSDCMTLIERWNYHQHSEAQYLFFRATLLARCCAMPNNIIMAIAQRYWLCKS